MTYRQVELEPPRVQRSPGLRTGVIVASQYLNGTPRSPIRLIQGFENVAVSDCGYIWRLGRYDSLWYRNEYWEDFKPDDERNVRTRKRRWWRS